MAAVIGIPVVYHNSAVKSAREEGILFGQNACQAEYTARANEALAEAERVFKEEAQRANEAEKKAAAAAKNAQLMKRKLDEALKKSPEVVGCTVNESATGVLRDGSLGKFTDESGAPALPKPFAKELPSAGADPGDETNPRSERHS